MTRQTDEARGLELAQRLEAVAGGEDAVIVVFAGCWLLASVLVQALEDRGDEERDPVVALEVVCAQLGRSFSELLAAREETKH